MTGNLKPAPFALTPATVAACLGERSVRTANAVDIPLESTPLVDRPRPCDLQAQFDAIREQIAGASQVLNKATDNLAWALLQASSVLSQIDFNSAPSTMTRTAPRSDEALSEARVDSLSDPAEGSGAHQATAAGESLLKPASVEPMKAAESAPVEPDQLDWPDAPLPENPATLNPVFVSEDDKHLRDIPARRSARAFTRTARDGLHVHAKDRDAREFEAPVDAKLARLDLIRAAAKSLGQDKSQGRILPGLRKESPKLQLPANPVAERRARLERAIGHLKRQGILVSVLDRAALIRKYRVSGKAESVLAEDVISIAIERGMSA